MNDAVLTNHSATKETLYGEYASHTNSRMYPDDNRSKSSSGIMSENRVPAFIPIALNSMLKTSTETGDIGQFAINPSRLQPFRKLGGAGNNDALREPQRHSSFSYGPQIFDDRRRLPSYARDTTSEIVSLYETASQKASSSPKIFEIPDHRSYSMTQTSYSGNALSNHRSYTSLRSQPELGSMPRPRSPFLYPARLKRLGFRPSSPMLTGERANKGRRAEHEHMSYATIINARSAPTLSTNVERPISPLTIRSDFSRTFQSQIGQFQPESRPYSPSVKAIESTGAPKFHSEPVTSKASPVINCSGCAPTPVNHHRRSPTSFATVSNKSHTPSPLYYDYTEDFNLEGVHDIEGAACTSSIHFVIDQNITDSGDAADEESSGCNFRTQSSSNSTGPHIPAKSSYGDSIESSEDQARVHSEYSQAERSTNVTRDIIPLYLDRRPYENPSAGLSDFIDFSGSAQSANVVGEVLILEDDVSQMDENLKSLHIREETGNTSGENTAETMSYLDRASSLRFSTYLPNFPMPPDQNMCVITNVSSQARNQQLSASLPIDKQSYQVVQQKNVHDEKEASNYHHQTALDNQIEETNCQLQKDFPSLPLQRSATTGDRRIRSSRYYSIDHGLSDLAQLISNFESSDEPFTPQKSYAHLPEDGIVHSAQPLKNSTTTRAGNHPSTLLSKTSSQPSSSLKSHTMLNKFRSDGDLKRSNSKPFKTGISAFGQDLVNPDNDGKDITKNPIVDNIPAHQDSQTAPSFSRPPSHAPQAVSPGQLSGPKNCVPQLMKALPPVPQNPKFELMSPHRLWPRKISSTSSPKDFEHSNSSTEIEPTQEEIAIIQPLYLQPKLENVPELEQIYPTPQRFRIKSKIFDTQRSHSPASSRPWNLDENYPWNGQQSNIHLSSLRSILPGSQSSTKLKLRVTSTSNSPSGTIRIHPEARGSLELRTPKDLFTSSSSLSGMFRQIGTQFGSRTSSTTRETALCNRAQATFMNNEIFDNNSDLVGLPVVPVTAYPISSTEVGSFFSEDSSRVRGHHSLRKRISKLRARIPNPYSIRTTPQNDNEEQREQIAPYSPANEILRANINSEQEDDYGIPVAILQRGRLISKISEWFKNAGLVIRRRVKLHNKDEVCCIPYR